ncbi:MAG: hypothetical protein E7158_05420 [Firmicutes bacterium]|nr:hypothetical protein [Bacillota bacterium]
MNTYNINDDNFINSDLYKDFIKENPSRGNLRIRAYTASGAIPIKDLKVTISTQYKSANIIFYEGETNESGVIEKISLPAPKLINDNLDVPKKTTYEILAVYEPEKLNNVYKVNMYEDVCVVQNINVAPKTLDVGEFRWQ